LINHSQREIIIKAAQQFYYLRVGIDTISVSTQKTGKDAGFGLDIIQKIVENLRAPLIKKAGLVKVPHST
jgi:hypothetical protein